MERSRLYLSDKIRQFLNFVLVIIFWRWKSRNKAEYPNIFISEDHIICSG